VFRGVDLMLERDVAIKVLRPELAVQPEIVERFRAEAVTLAKLNHPRIATLYSFFRHADHFLMVMEFVRGQTLGDLISEQGAISYERAVPMFCQALEGIDYAHSLGIIHRDVKPGNMMLSASGAVKVMDFGIARVLGAARMTKAGHLIGTIEYMSPEQVRGQHTDARSDIYSSGIVLYELLTGRVPFSSDSEYDLMRSQIEQPPPPLRDFSAEVPEYIEAAILRALAKKPEERFETAGGFRDALLAAVPIASRPVVPQTLPGFVEPTAAARLPQEDAARATRLAGGQLAPAVSQAESHPKGTRLAAGGAMNRGGAQKEPAFVSGQERGAARDDSQPATAGTDGILARLNWKHYTGACLLLSLLIFAAVGVSALMADGGNGSKVAEPPPGGAEAPVAGQPTPAVAPTGEPTPAQSVSRPAPPMETTNTGVEIFNAEEPAQPADEAGGAGQPERAKRTVRAETVRRARGGDAGARARSADAARRRAEALRVLDKN
jgi:serine/threonine-protein kinase